MMNSEKRVFCKKNFVDNLSNYFYEKNLCDVTIITDDGTRIPAHKIILCAGSKYFEAMFMGGLKEADQKEITIHEISGPIFKQLIEYCYTGKIEYDKDSVQILLPAASFLLFEEIVEECSNYLIQQLDPSNCIGILKFTKHHQLKTASRIAQIFFNMYFSWIVEESEFLNLDLNEAKELLSRDDIDVACEESIFQAVMNWINHDFYNRKPILINLLSVVRFPYLRRAYFHIVVESFVASLQDAVSLAYVRNMFKLQIIKPRTATIDKIAIISNTKFHKTIEIFDPIRENWVYAYDMSKQNRSCFGVVLFKHTLIFVGGYIDGRPQKTVQYLNLFDNSWHYLPPMNKERANVRVALVSGFIYAIGGNGSHLETTTERYNILTSRWEMLPNLNQPRTFPGVVGSMGKVYVAGGINQTDHLSCVEYYDPLTNTWNFANSFLCIRGEVGLAVLNNNIYAFGKCNRHNYIEEFHPIVGIWSRVPNYLNSYATSQVCTSGTNIMMLAGRIGHKLLQFDTNTLKWKQWPRSITPREFGTIISIPSKYVHKYLSNPANIKEN